MKHVLAAVIALSLCLAFGTVTQGAVQTSTDRNIQSVVQTINSTTDPSVKYDLGNQLAHLIYDANKADISNQTIDELAALLSEPTVLVAAAGSLGNIGPAARRAIPALEKALERGRAEDEAALRTFPILGGARAGDSICPALKKIGANPEPADCTNGVYELRLEKRSAPLR